MAAAAAFMRGPSFLPRTLKLALALSVTKRDSSEANSTALTLSSSAMTGAIGASDSSKPGAAHTTTARASGWRTLRFRCLRRLWPSATARCAAAMRDSSATSRAAAFGSGKAQRWTDSGMSAPRRLR